MTAHLSDDLPRLLTGDATRDEVLVAAEHLRGCPDCQQELVSAVVAHASLTSAQRFAPEIVSPGEPDAEPHLSAPLPDLSAIFERVHAEATAGPAKSHRARLLAVAAAAIVLAGGGITIAETVGSGSAPPSRSIGLAAFGTGTHPAKVTIVGTQTMRVDATSLPLLDSSHFYEIWLTDGARKRMQSVGAIGPDNRASLTVPPNVMSNYSDIEVSVQATSQTAYSGTSVLRGAYS
jgi:hypothetical protein